jgi:hypothetical protein
VGRSWSLPGLDVEVGSNPSGAHGEGDVWKVRFPVGTEGLTIELAAT